MTDCFVVVVVVVSYSNTSPCISFCFCVADRFRIMVSRHTLITVFGWAFDIFTVAISITDVVSDLLVARQFLAEGHELWAWLVFGCFINSSVVYSVILANLVFDQYNNEFKGKDGEHILPLRVLKLPFIVRFLIVLPLSQLAPTGMYFMQMFILPWMRGDSVCGGPVNGSTDSPTLNCREDDVHSPSSRMTTVNMQEAKEVEGTFTVVDRLKSAVQRQVVTHGMLFAETIVESIPQSIIQLLAITFLGKPSALQVVSMALSILSVVSKAYFLSVSYNIRVFVFKFALLSFDVMSMFYIFSTVLSQERSQDIALIGFEDLKVSYLSYVWFLKLLAMTGVTVLIGGFGLVAAILVDKIRRGNCEVDACRGRDLKRAIYAIFAVALLLVPVVLVQESVKLSWVIFFFIRWEPSHKSLPAASVMSSFLMRSANVTEVHDRIVHLIRYFYAHENCFQSYNGLCDRFVITTPFLYQYLDLLVATEDAFIARYQDAENASKSTTVSHRAASSFDISNRMRRAYANIDKKFEQTQHPLGYINLDPKVWSISREDFAVEQFLVEIASELIKSGNVKPHSSFVAKDLAQFCASALRDGEVHQILQKYRDIKRQLNDDTDLVICDESFEEQIDKWKYSTIFGDRLNFFWNTVHHPEPPIDFYQPDGYNMNVELNPIAVLFWMWFPFNVVNCGFSIVFMFVSFSTDFHNQNLLQAFCFYTSVFFGVVALLQLPTVLRYVRLLKPIATVCEIFHSTETAQSCVVSYYEVPPTVVISDTIPRRLLPEELVPVIAKYLGYDYDSSHLTVADCILMKQRHRFHS